MKSTDATKAGLRVRGQGTGYRPPREQGAGKMRPSKAEPDADEGKLDVDSIGDGLRLYAPLRIMAEQNQREHWAVKAKRQKMHRTAMSILLGGFHARCWLKAHGRSERFSVRLVRIGKRKMDSDGCVAGFKACRDGIAEVFGIDDGSDRWDWRYEQRIEKRYGVEITIEATNTRASEGRTR